MQDWDALPGGELVHRGLADLEAGVASVPAALLSIAATRLRDAGVPMPEKARLVADPASALYRLLEADDPDGAHSRYNALVRRLVSFERALECENASTATGCSS